MRKFDFYEFTGILAPGVVLLLGIGIIFPPIGDFLKENDFSGGDLGLFVILSYIGGHLVQAFGNWFERAYWGLRGGMPTDWVWKGEKDLVSDEQRAMLPKHLKTKLGLGMPEQLDQIEEKDWPPITRQIYTAVAASTRNARIDIFNGNYGMFRGIATVLYLLAITVLFACPCYRWAAAIVAGVGIIAHYRMNRFAKHYARELFVQFLQLPMPEKGSDVP